ncbi:hypothetical protein [Acinetobacter ursingii]|mgnify:CR=1 FL=1|nr:hypothetical protein [Acinetobacter ursingii]
MKAALTNFFIKACEKHTGQTKEQLAKKWGLYYFLTRSKTKAYYHTFFS